MAYQLVNLTTCKPFNRQFRQRVESVKARAHNAPLLVISPSCCAFSLSKASMVHSFGTKKSCCLEKQDMQLLSELS